MTCELPSNLVRYWAGSTIPMPVCTSNLVRYWAGPNKTTDLDLAGITREGEVRLNLVQPLHTHGPKGAKCWTGG